MPSAPSSSMWGGLMIMINLVQYHGTGISPENHLKIVFHEISFDLYLLISRRFVILLSSVQHFEP